MSGSRVTQLWSQPRKLQEDEEEPIVCMIGGGFARMWKLTEEKKHLTCNMKIEEPAWKSRAGEGRGLASFEVSTTYTIYMEPSRVAE